MAKITLQRAYDLALEHFQGGRTAEAGSACDQILAHNPRHAETLQLMGFLAVQLGRPDVAVGYLSKAAESAPSSPVILANLGEAYRRLGDIERAISVCRQAISVMPGYAEAHNNLGAALKDGKSFEGALNAFRQAIELAPERSSFYDNLGLTLLDAGQVDPAIDAFCKANSLEPNDAGTHVNLGVAYSRKKQFEKAIESYRDAITINSTLPTAYSNLGNAYLEINRIDEAAAAFQDALTLDPTLAEIHNNLGNAYREMGFLEKAVAASRRAVELKPDYSEARSNLLFNLNCLHGLDVHAIAEEHFQWNHQHAVVFHKFITPHSNDRAPDRRLRVGYISPDFRDHAVARFLLPWLEQIDRSQFEVFCYSNHPQVDQTTESIKRVVDFWRDIFLQSDQQTADSIREDRIDILVDLAGHTARNRLLVFALKPAPVQVSLIGYPNTTGLETMDYRVTDEYADPPGLTASLHSEKLIYLKPSAWCFHPLGDTPEIISSDRSVRPLTFCSFNNFAKVTDEMLQVWCKILQAAEGSRLLLKSRGLQCPIVRQRVTELMGGLGIASGRLVFASHEPNYSDHLALYGQADIALDTFPYHGTTTTCEALWMGVPVVTLAGKSHVSRVGVSLLTNVGLEELIARNTDEYVQIAVALANNPSRLGNLRSILRQRMQLSPLTDSKAFATNMQKTYRQMWKTWCATRA
jgi:protein O-GlcNAc transferase